MSGAPQRMSKLAACAPLALLQGPEAGLRETFKLADAPELWVIVLVIVPALAALSWLSYRKEQLTPGRRATLATLRFIAFAALVAVLFRPALVLRREEVLPAEVLVLVDDSASMRRVDTYAGDEAARKALGALLTASGPDGAMALGDASRSDLAAAALTREILPRLAAGEYVPRVFSFSGEIAPLGEPPELAGRGATTQIGSALAQALAAHRGRHVTDAVILSDGRQNSGLAASEAARAAAAIGLGVHTVAIGDTRAERNALLELAEAPTSILEGDEVAIAVRVVGRGTSSTERAYVVLEELEAGQGDEGGRVLFEREAQLSESGERITLVAPPGPGDPRTRERRLRVSIPPLEGETLLDDNKLELSVRVAPEKVRVLFVDGYPRWEYRYLKEMLKRADENIQMQAFLLSSTPDFLQESTRGVPALREVPTDRKTLLDDYDVVILGDVNPWAISPDPARCEEFLSSLAEFVERGGGLLLVAGEYENPHAYVSTALEPLFPVVLDRTEMASPHAASDEGFRPELEDPSQPHEIVRLLAEPDANRRMWEEPGGLDPQYWFQPVGRAKPGSQVLLRHPTEEGSSGRYPLLVAGYYPAGRTLFSAIDSTWRWRKRFGDLYHERFWRAAIRWLALGRLRSGDRRFRIEVAQSTYDIGATVAVEARVLDEDFQPSQRPAQEAWWSGPDGRPKEVALPSVPDRPGLYRATLDPDQPGLYRVWIDSGGERIASAEFEVELPSLENRDPAPDPLLLREVSRLSGGRAVDLSRLADLWAEFPGGEERREPISSRLTDVWDRWTTLICALIVLSVEWALRKRWELV